VKKNGRTIQFTRLSEIACHYLSMSDNEGSSVLDVAEEDLPLTEGAGDIH
jgi:hypothetical protein